MLTSQADNESTTDAISVDIIVDFANYLYYFPAIISDINSNPSVIKTMLELQQLKKIGKRYRRRLFELWGSDRYSRPAIKGMDRKLEKYLPNQGFFIETGANDGFTSSNTYYLERIKGWRGIPIEPIPELYRSCIRERPQSVILNFALVSSNYTETTVDMNYGHLMSLTASALEALPKHLERASQAFSIKPYEIKVPARTLTSILDDINVKEINFLYLDVEGYELEALKGLDFNKYRQDFMLIECLNEGFKTELEAYISDFYTCIGTLSTYDYLYQSSGVS